MSRLTNKDDRGRYYTVEEKILIANEPVNPTTTWIVHNENRRYGSPIEKLGKLEDLEEHLGCPLEVIFKAFKKYVSWTTDCDFGYDNIPDEYEAYRNDKRFKTLSYDSGLIYIAIQETLREDKSE